MTQLAKNKDVPIKVGDVESFLVEDNVRIYKGALVCLNAAGYLVPAADSANFTLAGIAYEECDNTLTGHAQGGKSCRVQRGVIAKVVATSITQAMLGEMMYVVDDQTVDDAVGTNAIKAGTLVDYESATSGWIQLPKGSLGQGAKAADASDLATAITLVNQIKGIINNYLV